MAVADYTAVIALEPTNGYQASLRALNKTMLGQGAEAVADCDAALAAQPDVHGINETCAMVYFKAGDLKKAGAGFDAAQKTAGATDAQPIYGRALVTQRNAGAAAAKADFDKALALDPKIAEYYERFGLSRTVAKALR
jgi:tetratricopeptide (TPR) repeat protein